MLHTNDILAVVAAIFITEGGNNAKVPYGILSCKVQSANEARAICTRTVIHAAKDFRADNISTNFIVRLSNRYCPPSCDPKGNKNWRRNMIAILKPKI